MNVHERDTTIICMMLYKYYLHFVFITETCQPLIPVGYCLHLIFADRYRETIKINNYTSHNDTIIRYDTIKKTSNSIVFHMHAWDVMMVVVIQ